MTIDTVIVLGNLMDSAGDLNGESRARVDLACQLVNDGIAKRLLTCGWAYRNDCDLPIGEAMASYARQFVVEEIVSVEPRSRDTVGDAIFSRMKLELPAKSILVATSDYHVARTAEIFEFVYGAPVQVFGAATDADKLRSESQSLAAFRSTFADVMAGDLFAIYRRMMEAHPFYNGEALPAFH